MLSFKALLYAQQLSKVFYPYIISQCNILLGTCKLN